MNTELAKVETALTEFDKIEAGQAELRGKYVGVVYPVTTTDGMREALAARAVIRKPRYTTEEIRKAAKAPILELGRTLDAKAKYITAELLKIEDPIQAQIAVEESRKEQAVIAENQRKAAITQAIYDLHMIVSDMAGKSSVEIAARILALQEHELTEWAEEFIAEAEKARAGAITSLEQLRAGALALEQAAAVETARVANEKADFERRKAELAEREKAEAVRIAQEAQERANAEAVTKARLQADERASRARIDAQEAESRKAREAADKEAKAIRDAAEAALKAERDEIDRKARLLAEAQRREQDAIEAKARAAANNERLRLMAIQEEEEEKVKAEQSRQEAQQREVARRLNEKADAIEAAELFLDKWGHLPAWKRTAKAIELDLAAQKVMT